MTLVAACRRLAAGVIACLTGLGVCAGAASAAATPSTLTVTVAGTGSGALTSAPAGIGCTSGTCTASFDSTTSVVLTAAPAAGDGFGGFSGAGCSTSPCTVSMAADVTVTATFDAPPTASITAPQDGMSYSANAVPAAAFACSHDPNSTLRSCLGTVDGTAVSSGATLPATPGPHTLTVVATDADGSTSLPASVTYTVFPRPTCSDVGATTNEGTPVSVALSCADPHASSITYAIDRRPRHGSIGRPRGAVIYTPDARFAGTDSFTYEGRSADGESAEHTATVVVLAPPTAQITAPGAGQVYTVGQAVPTRFSCTDDPNGPGIRSCTDSAGVSDGTGTLNTSTAGNHTYGVTATSADGQTGSATIGYTVVGKAPGIVVTAPVDNAAYLWTALPAADFTCVPGVGSTVQSCKATVGGQAISDHQPLPNALGAHTMTIIATDADGLSAT